MIVTIPSRCFVIQTEWTQMCCHTMPYNCTAHMSYFGTCSHTYYIHCFMIDIVEYILYHNLSYCITLQSIYHVVSWCIVYVYVYIITYYKHNNTTQWPCVSLTRTWLSICIEIRGPCHPPQRPHFHWDLWRLVRWVPAIVQQVSCWLRGV